jgi:hypothetical protein
MHIAQSVVNGIHNAARMIPAESNEMPMPVPTMPPVAAQGAQIDAQLQTPPVPTAMPEGADGAMAVASATGEGGLLDAAIASQVE